MKTIIAGSRDFVDYEVLKAAIFSCPWEITTVVSGKARGADTLGEQYAKEHNIHIAEYPADWTKNGRAAGYIRNKEMSDNAEALIAFWDGTSRGTKNMIDTAKKAGHKVMIYNFVNGNMIFK